MWWTPPLSLQPACASSRGTTTAHALCYRRNAGKAVSLENQAAVGNLSTLSVRLVPRAVMCFDLVAPFKAAHTFCEAWHDNPWRPTQRLTLSRATVSVPDAPRPVIIHGIHSEDLCCSALDYFDDRMCGDGILAAIEALLVWVEVTRHS